MRVQTPDGLTLHFPDGDRVGNAVARRGVYEPWTAEAIESLPAAGTFVDIGAHVGYFSALAARRVGPGGNIYAFEPDPVLFKLLQENVVAGMEAGRREGRTANAELFHAAAWNKGGMIRFHAEGPMGIISPAGEIDVSASRADECLRRAPRTIDLVKIDTQGAERQVLEGMSGVLSDVRAMVVEVCPYLHIKFGAVITDITGLLFGAGFECFVARTGQVIRGAAEVEAACLTWGHIDVYATRAKGRPFPWPRRRGR